MGGRSATARSAAVSCGSPGVKLLAGGRKGGHARRCARSLHEQCGCSVRRRCSVVPMVRVSRGPVPQIGGRSQAGRWRVTSLSASRAQLSKLWNVEPPAFEFKCEHRADATHCSGTGSGLCALGSLGLWDSGSGSRPPPAPLSALVDEKIKTDFSS